MRQISEFIFSAKTRPCQELLSHLLSFLTPLAHFGEGSPQVPAGHAFAAACKKNGTQFSHKLCHCRRGGDLGLHLSPTLLCHGWRGGNFGLYFFFLHLSAMTGGGIFCLHFLSTPHCHNWRGESWPAFFPHLFAMTGWGNVA